MKYVLFLAVCAAIPVVMAMISYAVVYLGNKSFD